MEYFKYPDTMITNDATCMREINSRIVMPKAAFSNNKKFVVRKRLVKCYTWSIALYGAEHWTLRKADQIYLESFKMWC
jgi:hypothetical protein